MLFEEVGGDPTQLSFATRSVMSVCAHVSESHPPPIEMWTKSSETGTKTAPVLSLSCPSPDHVISSIKFASFGTPVGTCGSFRKGKCSSSSDTLAIVQKVIQSIKQFPYNLMKHYFIVLTNLGFHKIMGQACMGMKSCSIEVSADTFGEPCQGVIRSLAVEASCA